MSMERVCEVRLVPPISDEKIELMLELMQPVVELRIDDHHRYRLQNIEGVDRRDTAYLWNDRPGRLVKLYKDGMDSKEILTFHTWAYYGFFKPTLAEVCACIDQCVVDWSNIRYFCLDSKAVGLPNIIGDYHWCRCRLFGGEALQVQDSRWNADVAYWEEKLAEPLVEA